MIRALVVDDERLARDEMTFLLSRLDDIELAGEAANGETALDMVSRERIDVVLLDIEMPNMNGFQFVEQLLEEDHVPDIIFVTAYDEYAVRAFEVNALDYLLKPVDENRLKVALDRVQTDNGDVREQLAGLVQSLSEQSPSLPPKIAVKKGDRHILLAPSQITHCYILDGVVFVATAEIKGITQHRTLEELEADLDSTVFWRVHRSYVVNISHVMEIIPWQSGTYRLRLDDTEGTLVPLSRAQARRIRQILKW